MNVKMAEAVTLAMMGETADVDAALGVAAIHGRFATADLASILKVATHRTATHTATEATSLAQGTGG